MKRSGYNYHTFGYHCLRSRHTVHIEGRKAVSAEEVLDGKFKLLCKDDNEYFGVQDLKNSGCYTPL